MNIISYGWPIALLVVAHTIYQISAKSVPDAMDPFAAVFFNYVVAAALAFCLWMVMGQDRSLTTQLSKMNWAPVTMAMAITAVEVASVFMYKVGWNISIGSTVANILTAIALAGVGVLIYKDVMTVNQLIGIGLCIAGLVVMNR
ncbi:MAG: EamA family transporter [Firmicutes bacterium]|nr:EamA family transporter [Bacillota bacterium]